MKRWTKDKIQETWQKLELRIAENDGRIMPGRKAKKSIT